MLKVREISDDGPTRTRFRLGEGGGPPTPQTLSRLVAVAGQLLTENGLHGAFRQSGPSEVTLEVDESARHFLHEGILFAALDAVNDPVKSPTLTLLSGRSAG
jgi:hypothetical protein